MRNVTILMALAAIAALPVAAALEDQTLVVPEANVHVEGTRVPLDSVPVVPGAPAAVRGEIVVNDVDVSVSETRCGIDTDLNVKRHGGSAPQCTAGELSAATPPTEIVDYELEIVLPGQASEGDADVGAASGSAVLTPIVSAEPVVLLAAAAATGASLAAFYGVWRVLKWTGMAAFIPLYSHIRDDEILDDPNRAAIYRLIQAEPGISTKDVADRLHLAWGTVTHHLGKLEKRRFVVSKKYGKYRRYFANGEGGTDQKDALAVLRLDRTGDVAALIRAQPGLTQKAVSQALGVSSSTILWHVKRLEEVQLVRKVREGKLVRYYPGDGMQGVALIPAAQTPTAA